MPVGTAADFQIYPEQFNSAFTETLEQETGAFNEGSAGAIRLVTQARRGDYNYESFFQSITGLDVRRDNQVATAAAILAMPQDEIISVKLNRRQGPVQQTIDSFKKQQLNPEVMSFVLGQQSAKAVAVQYLNSALLSARASITNGGGAGVSFFDGTAATIDYAALSQGLQLFGDAGSRLIALVMHSKPFYDLFRDGLTNFKIDVVAGVTIVEGTAATMGRPVIVTDSPSLITTGVPDTYHTLLLTADGVMVEESETSTLHSDVKGGLENLVLEWQFEYAYNLENKGYKWDVAAGGANPADAALGTATNWDLAMTDLKSTAGVMVNTQ